MNHRGSQGTLWIVRLAVVVACIVPVIVVAQGNAQWREGTIIRVEPGPWTGPRLPDGQPDVQGHWSNTQGNHENLTGAAASGDDLAAGRGGGGVPSGRGGRPRINRVTDPPDGRVPFQPWALVKADEFRRHLSDPVRPEHVEPLARCAPAGPTKSFMWHGYEIRQYPGYIVFFFNSSNRIISLEDKPHLPDTVKLWNGDSRGRWEGNSLIVDVRNNNSKWRFARSGEFVSEHATIQERFTFASSGERFIYDATYTDPTVLTKPFTISIPNKRVTADTPGDGWNNETMFAEHDGHEPIIEIWERSCVEGNAAHGMIVGQAQER